MRADDVIVYYQNTGCRAINKLHPNRFSPTTVPTQQLHSVGSATAFVQAKTQPLLHKSYLGNQWADVDHALNSSSWTSLLSLKHHLTTAPTPIPKWPNSATQPIHCLLNLHCTQKSQKHRLHIVHELHFQIHLR
jgi:hypothetical protein